MAAIHRDADKGCREKLKVAGIMDKLQALEDTVDALLDHCQQLVADNRNLRARELQWRWEREQLLKKNEVARSRVEAMINRLKGLKPENQ